MSEVLARRVSALVLGVLACAAVLEAQRDVGVVRDEIVYMRAGSDYSHWWADLLTGGDGTAAEKRITKVFGGKPGAASNPEHPPLMKTLFGASEALFHQRLGWMSRVTAYRFPNAALFGVLIALAFLFAAREWGLAVGAMSGALLLATPRLFFHAGLAAFDAPVVAWWFATVFCYYRALERRWWAIPLGVVFGCALATKHNAVLLPPALAAHYAVVAWRRGGNGARGIQAHLLAVARGLWRVNPWIWLALAALSPLVTIGLWPWLWFDTIAHASSWFAFHLEHVHYNFEYLGRNWNAPPFPWHVAVVTTALTIPVATLVAGLMGAVHLVWRARPGQPRAADAVFPGLLLFLSAGAAMGPFLLTTTPIFGAEKHWAAAFPTISIFAGVGAAAVASRAARTLWAHGEAARRRAAISALAAVLVVAAAMSETLAAHPYALSHYNALAGGAPGGADLGMNRQFWGYSARGALPWLNQRAPAAGAPARCVYTHDASMAWATYRSEGLLAPGLPDAGHELTGIRHSEFALVVHELHFNRHDYLIWQDYGTVQPAFVLTDHGVPLVSVYERGEPPKVSCRP